MLSGTPGVRFRPSKAQEAFRKTSTSECAHGDGKGILEGWIASHLSAKGCSWAEVKDLRITGWREEHPGTVQPPRLAHGNDGSCASVFKAVF